MWCHKKLMQKVTSKSILKNQDLGPTKYIFWKFLRNDEVCPAQGDNSFIKEESLVKSKSKPKGFRVFRKFPVPDQNHLVSDSIGTRYKSLNSWKHKIWITGNVFQNILTLDKWDWSRKCGFRSEKKIVCCHQSFRKHRNKTIGAVLFWVCVTEEFYLKDDMYIMQISTTLYSVLLNLLSWNIFMPNLRETNINKFYQKNYLVHSISFKIVLS